MLTLPDVAARERLAGFAGRVVRLDVGAVIRLQAADGEVTAWAPTTFDVLATLSVPGTADPADVTVIGNELLAALAVGRTTEVDPGTRAEARWRAELPPRTGWKPAGEVSAAELDRLTDRGLALARGNADPHGVPPAGLLDEVALTVGAPPGAVQVPMRCLFALAGMGVVDGVTPISVAALPGWLRLDAVHGSVVRQRRTMLPLLVTG